MARTRKMLLSSIAVFLILFLVTGFTACSSSSSESERIEVTTYTSILDTSAGWVYIQNDSSKYESTYSLLGVTSGNFGYSTIFPTCHVKLMVPYSGNEIDALRVIPCAYTSIGDFAFVHDTNFRWVSILGNYETIGNYSFCRSSIEGVTIDTSAKEMSIGCYCFYSCKNLERVILSDNVTYIGEHAFDGCDNLTAIYYCGNAADWGMVDIEEGNDFAKDVVRFYRETQPHSTERIYWHYVNGVPVDW